MNCEIHDRTDVCRKSPAHALVAALALLSEDSPVAVAKNGTFIGRDRVAWAIKAGVTPRAKAARRRVIR